MIRVHALTKKYGAKVAVDGIDFTVEPGKVTGFLGPNGAGKSTTMRMLVGLDRPTAGSAEVNGRSYAALPAPLCEVGVLLDARSAHRFRSAQKHLRAIAATHVGRGMTNAEIAETLHLSESTVEAHFGRILTKLDLPNRAQAVILAYELGIV